MQGTIDIVETAAESADLWEKAGEAVIAHGPWAAAFLIVFFALLGIVVWTLKASVREVRDARSGERASNERAMQLSEKTVETNTQLKDRLDRVLEVQNKILDQMEGGSTT
ncbi:hypothetical protein LCGC14_1040830 [marine sediment metagenome]|uniref:Uncharacterized protein n=1 Tax=marine sediment metagenome TaxID=412755 RepID=A0A0F9QY01_9ZZZZ